MTRLFTSEPFAPPAPAAGPGSAHTAGEGSRESGSVSGPQSQASQSAGRLWPQHLGNPADRETDRVSQAIRTEVLEGVISLKQFFGPYVVILYAVKT